MAGGGGSKRQAVKDGRNSMQKVAFTLWLNRRLKKFNIVIEDVFKDLADGKALFCLIEDLTKKKLQRQNSFSDSKNRYFQMESVGLALKYLRKEGVSLRNIGPEDIVDGRENLILGLLWTLMSHFECRALARRPESADPDAVQGPCKTASFKDKMLELVQDKLPGKKVANFGDDWTDGASLVALVTSVDSDLGSQWPDLREEVDSSDADDDSDVSKKLARARAALEAAESALQIPPLFSAEDLLAGHVDEGSMMLYLSQFFLGREDSRDSKNAVQSESDALQRFKACSTARRSFSSRKKSLVHTLVHSFNSSVDDGYESQPGSRRTLDEDAQRGQDRKPDADLCHKDEDKRRDMRLAQQDGNRAPDNGELNKVKDSGGDDTLLSSLSSSSTNSSSDVNAASASEEDTNEDSDDDDDDDDESDSTSCSDSDEGGVNDADVDQDSTGSSDASYSTETGIPPELKDCDASVLQQYWEALGGGEHRVYQGRLIIASPSSALASSLKQTLLDYSVSGAGTDTCSEIQMVDGRQAHCTKKSGSMSHRMKLSTGQIDVISTLPAEKVMHKDGDVWLIALDASHCLNCGSEDKAGVPGREFLRECLWAIHSQKKERTALGDLWSPPVILVGVGSNQKTQYQRQTFKRELNHFLRHKVYSPHIYDIVVLENEHKRAGPEALHLAAIKLVVSRPQWGRKEPTRWRRLLRKLQDSVEDTWPILRQEQVSDLAIKCGITGHSQLRAFLEYYHAVREIIHTEESGLVVFRPQSLYDMSRRLPMFQQNNKEANKMRSSDEIQNVSDLLLKTGICAPLQMEEPSRKGHFFLRSLSNPSDSDAVHCVRIPDVFFRFTSIDQRFDADGDGIVPVSLFHAVASHCHDTSGWQWAGAVQWDYAMFAPQEISPYLIALQLLEGAIRVSVQLRGTVGDDENDDDDDDNDVDLFQEHLPALLCHLEASARGRVTQGYPNLQLQLCISCGHGGNKKSRFGKGQGHGSMQNYMTRQRLDGPRYLPLRPEDVAFGETVWCDVHERGVEADPWKPWFDISV